MERARKVRTQAGSSSGVCTGSASPPLASEESSGMDSSGSRSESRCSGAAGVAPLPLPLPLPLRLARLPAA